MLQWELFSALYTLSYYQFALIRALQRFIYAIVLLIRLSKSSLALYARYRIINSPQQELFSALLPLNFITFQITLLFIYRRQIGYYIYVRPRSHSPSHLGGVSGAYHPKNVNIILFKDPPGAFWPKFNIYTKIFKKDFQKTIFY